MFSSEMFPDDARTFLLDIKRGLEANSVDWSRGTGPRKRAPFCVQLNLELLQRMRAFGMRIAQQSSALCLGCQGRNRDPPRFDVGLFPLHPRCSEARKRKGKRRERTLSPRSSVYGDGGALSRRRPRLEAVHTEEAQAPAFRLPGHGTRRLPAASTSTHGSQINVSSAARTQLAFVVQLYILPSAVS
jgi:hypothetical protein